MEKLETIMPELYQTIVNVVDTRMQEVKVTREDFNELKDTVSRLADTVGELAQAQARTEKTVDKLVQAQRETEKTVDELGQAQRKTEKELQLLTGTVKRAQKELGGLSHTVGYTLEDRGINSLPPLLKRDFGIELQGKLERKFIDYPDGNYDVVNIIGKGKKQGKRVIIIGEAKTQLSKRDIDNLQKKIKRVSTVLDNGEFLPLMVTYSLRPPVEKYASEKMVKIYLSYELG